MARQEERWERAVYFLIPGIYMWSINSNSLHLVCESKRWCVSICVSLLNVTLKIDAHFLFCCGLWSRTEQRTNELIGQRARDQTTLCFSLCVFIENI